MSDESPDLKTMVSWDDDLVREVNYYDIDHNVMRQRFDYLGPDGITHHISFCDPVLNVRSQAIDALKKHFEENYNARKED